MLLFLGCLCESMCAYVINKINRGSCLPKNLLSVVKHVFSSIMSSQKGNQILGFRRDNNSRKSSVCCTNKHTCTFIHVRDKLVERWEEENSNQQQFYWVWWYYNYFKLYLYSYIVLWEGFRSVKYRLTIWGIWFVAPAHFQVVAWTLEVMVVMLVMMVAGVELSPRLRVRV